MLSFLGSVYKLYKLYRFYSQFIHLFDVENSLDITKDNYEEKLEPYKNLIYDGGFIYIKIAQWIVSKYRSYEEENIMLVCHYLEEIFENCPEHDFTFSKKLLDELFDNNIETDLESSLSYNVNNYNNNINKFIKKDTIKFIASGSIGQIYYAELINPIYIIDTSNKIFQDVDKVLLAEYDTIHFNKKDIIKELMSMITNYTINENDIRYEDKNDYENDYKNNNICDNNANKDLENNNICDNNSNDNKTYFYDLIKEVKEVAIKVKHPDVYYNLEKELAMFRSVNQLKSIPIIRSYLDYQIDFEDLINNIMEQCNLNNEYINGSKLRINMAGNHLVYIPKILFHNEHCLITEFVTGKYLEEIDNYNKYKICLNFISIINKMCLIDNFVHGDLHCKNWKIRKYNDIDYQIILYDYGICFQSKDIELTKQIWKIFEDCSVKGLHDLLDKLIEGEINDEIRDYIKEYLNNYKYSNLNFSKLFNELNQILKRYNCYITSFALKISIVTSIIESTLKSQNILESEDIIYEEDTHDVKVREKKLDIIAFCKSKKQYPQLQKYLDSTLKKIKKQSMFSSINLNGLDLDLPEL